MVVNGEPEPKIEVKRSFIGGMIIINAKRLRGRFAKGPAAKDMAAFFAIDGEIE
jgi:hypothetical protein